MLTIPIRHTFTPVILMLTACCANAPLDQRWASDHPPTYETVADTAPGAPRLWVAATPAEASGGIKPKDLADHAGAAYFEQLGKLTQTSGDFIKLAGKPIGEQNKKINTTSIDRILIIAVSRPDFSPGDRLIRTKVTLKPQNFKFSNYTVAATAYSTINIDNISHTKTNSVGGEFDPTFTGKITGSGKLTASSSDSVTNTAQISQQIEQLTVSVEDDNLIIYREGERGLDLTGTTLIKLSLSVKDPNAGTSIEYTVDSATLYKDDKALDPAVATLTLAETVVAKPVDYQVKASLEYVERHVVAGAQTYTESDDTIKFISGTTPAKESSFTVLNMSEMVIPRWVIRAGKGGPALNIDASVGDREAVFTNYESAQMFAHWLSLKKATAVGVHGLAIYDFMTGQTEPLKSHKGSYPTFIVERYDG
jgi:hypothetical protein